VEVVLLFMLFGKNRETGKWFELYGRSIFVCDVYIVEIGDFMKYPSSMLVCV
jgi:hypothetical protein